MAEYPKQFIEKLDAQCGKEAWPLIGWFLLDLAVAVAGIYIVGELANSLL
jgi:hypothetical protein